ENPSEMDELLPDLSDPLQRNVRHLHEDLIFEELDLPRKVLDEREVVVDDGVEERVGDRGGLRPASGILLQRIEEGVNLGDRLIVDSDQKSGAEKDVDLVQRHTRPRRIDPHRIEDDEEIAGISVE